ncbi:MAG: Enterobactin exporter EntS [Acidobacteria bacterium]|nr:Enterobactin exporter EntS [Acidobacteriota bacterium]
MHDQAVKQSKSPQVSEVEDDAGQDHFGGTFRALRHHNYRLIWIGFFLSNIGTWMQTVAQGWLVRDLTASTALIGFVSFASSFPQVAFSLFGGASADMFNRRKLLIGTQTVHLFNAAALGALVLARDWIKWEGLSLWHVIAFTFASGVSSTLATPAFQALTLDLVGREDLPSAVAMNSAQFNLSRIIGPTIGGLLFGVIGIAGCYFLNSASFLAVIAALWMLRLPPWSAPEDRNAREMWRQTIAGIRYVRKRPRVQALLGIATVMSVCGLPYLIFLPVFARDVLNQEARGLAQMWAATGAGALMSALLMAYNLSNSRRRGRLLLIANIFFGLAVVAFGVSRNFALSCLCLALVGGGMVSVTTTVNTLLQTLVRDQMRGRVMSMYALAFVGLPPVGGLLIGVLADLIGWRWGHHGMQWAMAAGGAIIALFAVGVMALVPRVKELE